MREKDKELIYDFVFCGDTYGGIKKLRIENYKLISNDVVVAVRTPVGIILNNTKHDDIITESQIYLRKTKRVVQEVTEDEMLDIVNSYYW